MAASEGSTPLVSKGSGSPVLFLHGYPLHRAMWAAQLGGLSDRHRIALLDLPGYGTAANQAVPDTLSGFANAVRSTVERELGGTATIVGHSFGGYVALQLYREHPEVFDRLILVSTRAGADSPEARDKRYATARRLGDSNEHLNVDETAKSLVAEATWTARGPVVEVVRAIVASASNPTVIRTLVAIADRVDQTPILPNIRVPTLVIWGAGDGLIPPAQTQVLAKAIPGAKGVEIPNAGHLSPLEEPAAFNGAVQSFLAASDRKDRP
jgi:3-oxoadipate enol-lactonase